VVTFNGGCMDSITKDVSVTTSFDGQLVLNADTSICIGDSVLLRTASGLLNYCWQTSAGTPPSFLNGYVKPQVNTTYVLNSYTTGANLVVNGDFSSGNTGFTSSYSYNPASGFNAGVYNVGSNITAWHPGMAACSDHTSGSGNMLMVNGADVANVNVWTQTVPVTPNTNYAFSSWLQNITTINPASLQFAINGIALGSVFNANQQSCVWERFYTIWNSGANTTATISVMNMNTQFSGNDLALDDVYFGIVTPRVDSFHVQVSPGCDSIRLNGPNKICSKTDTVTYTITKAANCTQAFSVNVDNAYATIVSQTPTTIKLLFSQNGTTSVKVFINTGCKIVADSIAVTIKLSPPSFNFGPDISSCRDTSTLLHAGPGFESYLWQNGTTDSVYQASGQGMYFVTAQNYCGALFKDSIRIIRSVPVAFQALPLSAKCLYW
jgi:hypothetical protein